MMPRMLLALAAVLALNPAFAAEPPKPEPAHNAILFIADGLRAAIVDQATAPAMAGLRDSGVNFQNSHALYPTLTTANASGFATGHYLGDTGDWANTIFVGFPVAKALDSVTPFIENDAVLGELDAHFGGDYLGRQTVMAAARAAGYGTAAVGKLGPTLIQDHTARDGNATIVIDDATGRNDANDGPRRGIPLSPPVLDALDAANLLRSAPPSAVPNQEQQDYFVAAFTNAVLPLLKSRGKPFYAVFWSRDPDGSQHNQTDGLGQLIPGINGPTSLKGIANADSDLARIRQALKALDLDGTTDVIVAADHGFSTIDKESATSDAARMSFQDLPAGGLPSGFVAIDLAHALGLKLFDPDNGKGEIAEGTQPRRGNGLIGPDPAHPEVVVAANGGSDVLYLPQPNPTLLARKIVGALLRQDYTSGLFVRDDLGPIPGALPLSTIGLKGAAVTPRPAIILGFRSFSTGCENPLKCTAEIADTSLRQGQGMHGSFSRADTDNFQAAIGPDFKPGFVDTAPSSNADIAVTIAHILKLKPGGTGELRGRVLDEALTGGAMPDVKRQTVVSAPAANGLITVLDMQSVGPVRYFDVAGFPGRTVGLPR